MVLHVLVAVLAVSVLAGMRFDYTVLNPENEIIILVDVSGTMNYGITGDGENSVDTARIRDDFVQTILAQGRFDNFKIGIVTFGFDQVEAVPLRHINSLDDVTQAFNQYLRAELPDTSATNIAAALTFARGLFENYETGKIVLVTDGKETDEYASEVIRIIAAHGIRVDVAFIPSCFGGNDAQFIGVEFPNRNLSRDEEFSVSVSFQTRGNNSMYIELYSNGVMCPDNGRKRVETGPGVHTIEFVHSFYRQGFHEIIFEMTDVYEFSRTENKRYITYFYLDEFNNILILESFVGESDGIVSLLIQDEKYYVTVLCIITSDEIPTTLEELVVFDQVILFNISQINLTGHNNPHLSRDTNPDLPAGFRFDFLLRQYVELGGGLLTVGGSDAYRRQDMFGSNFQDMLPVEAIDFTPPLGLFLLVDVSGSMSATTADGRTRIQHAQIGARAAFHALDYRDFLGIILWHSDGEHILLLPLTPVTREDVINNAIDQITTPMGGTVLPQALRQAGMLLRVDDRFTRRHIMVISDGEIPLNQTVQIEPMLRDFHQRDRTTMSFIGIGLSLNTDFNRTSRLEDICAEALGRPLTNCERMTRFVIIGGRGHIHFMHDPAGIGGVGLPSIIREHVLGVAWYEDNHIPFYPDINAFGSPLLDGIERQTMLVVDVENPGTYVEIEIPRMTVQLGGFHGVRLRPGAELILSGEHDIPIYAQWRLGRGMVGSFSVDLIGRANSWSEEFLHDENGQQFILNVVNGLMPLSTIRASAITVNFREFNYINQISIFPRDGQTLLQPGQTIRGEVINMSCPDRTSFSLNTVGDDRDLNFTTWALANDFSRTHFIIRQPGVYKILLIKYDEDGFTQLTSFQIFKTFSFSQEYNTFWEETDDEIRARMLLLANRAGGFLIEDIEGPGGFDEPYQVFLGFRTHLEREFDPRTLFIILAIVLFLLDIAVRKFKFKWPHEIYRQRMVKKAERQKAYMKN